MKPTAQQVEDAARAIASGMPSITGLNNQQANYDTAWGGMKKWYRDLAGFAITQFGTKVERKIMRLPHEAGCTPPCSCLKSKALAAVRGEV